MMCLKCFLTELNKKKKPLSELKKGNNHFRWEIPKNEKTSKNIKKC